MLPGEHYPVTGVVGGGFALHLDARPSGHHDACMRTTLTLDPDLFSELQALARQTGASFKEVVNTALRQGLAQGKKPAAPLPPFVVKPFSSAFRPGIDPNRLNQLNDELEIEDFLREASLE